MRIFAFCLTALLFTSASLFADESSFVGTWDTDWGLLVIKKSETGLSGKYTGQFSGTVEGKVTEGKFHYVWKQTNGEWGSGVFTVSEDGSTIKGTWGGAKSETNGGTWTGKRES